MYYAFSYVDMYLLQHLWVFTQRFHKFFTNMKKGTFRYIHHGKTTFQTGLQFYLLQEYYLIALDVFRNFHYANSSNSINLTEQELHAWISFLVTENLNDTNQLIQK